MTQVFVGVGSNVDRERSIPAGIAALVVAGGVGANARLRERLAGVGRPVFYPRPEFCTDNGAMVAYAGYVRLAAGAGAPLAIGAKARWALDTLRPATGG